VGQLVQGLEKANMWENTLLVLSSDNGGASFVGNDPCCIANNHPLRGSKSTPFEGGVRVVSFAAGGLLERIAPLMIGRELDGLLHLADWYATFCHLANVDVFDDRAALAGLPPVDGVNVWPYIAGLAPTSPRHSIHVDNRTLINSQLLSM
jgi:arylsulfatase A-like enzyme